MIKRIFSLLILVPIAIVLIVLSVANRQVVTLALNPFAPSDPVLSVSAPLFLFLFAALIVGMLIGSVATWFKQGKYRAKARTHQREAVMWQTEADKLKTAATPPAPTAGLPAITSAKG